MYSGALVMLLVSKLFRTPLMYLSNVVSRNFTSQIYLDTVLVKGGSPPRLVNQVRLSMLIEFVLFVVLLGIIYAGNYIFGGFPALTKEVMASYMVLDFVFYMVMSISMGSMIADVMYKKKYFLYKDDGLRAIRALSELTIVISLLLTAIPFNYIIFGLAGELKRT